LVPQPAGPDFRRQRYRIPARAERQSRREIMLIFLWVLAIFCQAQTELTKIFDGAIRRRVPLRDLSCARLALRPVLLPSNTQVGQHEKNANQCN